MTQNPTLGDLGLNSPAVSAEAAPPTIEHPPGRVVGITVGLIAINVIVFLVMCFSGVSILDPTPLDLIDWGASFGPITIGHQWWRIGSSMFLHVGLMHLLVNMLCLFTLGATAEFTFDSWILLVTYLLSGLGGSLMSLMVHPDSVGAGASGAIFGVAGALLTASVVYGKTEAAKALGAQRKRFTTFLLMNLGYGILEPGIDVAAHLGGALTGAVLGLILFTPSAIGGKATLKRILGVATVGTMSLLLWASRVGHAHTLSPAKYNEVLSEIAAERRNSVRQDEKEETAAQREEGRRQRRGELEKAVQAGAASGDDYRELGALYATDGKNEEAITTFQKGLARHPQDPGLLKALGAVAYNLGRLDIAIEAFADLRTVAPDSEVTLDLQTAYLDRANQRKEAGQMDLSRADYKEVLALGESSSASQEARRALDSLSHVQ